MRFRSLNSYQITEEKHQHFLLEERNDPVTGDSFSEGDEVVFCSICKSAFFKDSWKYMGNKHCDQRSTLPIFPKSKKLTLQKPIELPFVFVDTDSRSSVFFVDIFILVGLCITIAVITVRMHITISSYFYAVLSFVLFTFRDSILINKSIGKAFQKMYFIDVNTNLPATFWQTLGRNLLYWVMNAFFLLFIVIVNALNKTIHNAITFIIIIGLVSLIINFYYIKHNIDNGYSWFDKLLGIRLVKKKAVISHQ